MQAGPCHRGEGVYVAVPDYHAPTPGEEKVTVNIDDERDHPHIRRWDQIMGSFDQIESLELRRKLGITDW